MGLDEIVVGVVLEVVAAAEYGLEQQVCGVAVGRHSQEDRIENPGPEGGTAGQGRVELGQLRSILREGLEELGRIRQAVRVEIQRGPS